MDLRLKDEMIASSFEEAKKELRKNTPDWWYDLNPHWIDEEIKEIQKTWDANKTARNKDFLDEYGKQVDWGKVEGKELEERRTLYQQVKEFHKSG